MKTVIEKQPVWEIERLFPLMGTIGLFLLVLFVFCSLQLDNKASWGLIGSIDVIILLSYVLYRPQNIFHPNNMVFAFYFLYMILPTTIFYIFETYSISLSLPWLPPDWLSFLPQVYQHILLSFLLIFYGFHYFCINIKPKPLKPLSIKMDNFWMLLAFLMLCYVIFITSSGGLGVWIHNYQQAYLQNRKGLGFLNFFIVFLSPLVCFLLGLITSQSHGHKKWLLMGSSLFLMLFFAYFQGLKSRYPVFLIIYFYPYLQQVKLSNKLLFILGISFFSFLFLANYLRSDGFYSSFAMHVEYLMSYFNVFYLHNMFLHDFLSGWSNTLHFPFIKYLQVFANYDPAADFDLSVMLTKFYFPNQWYLESATQQWPLISDLYYNFYGFILGWIPLTLYILIISKLYKLFCDFHPSLILIYLLEFFRLFSMQRSTLIPWEFLVILLFYVLIYAYSRITIRSGLQQVVA